MKDSRLANRLDNINESATIRMAQLGREVAAQGHDVISLSLGEPDFDTPDHIKEAANQALKDGYTKYTPVPGLLEFRKAIVQKLERDNGLKYSVDNIMVSCGAKQCISNTIQALVNPGDEVIIFTPYWVSYFDIVTMNEGVPVQLKAGIDQNFKVTAEQLRAAITDKTKAILFSSPCNPTGSVFRKNELEEMAKVLEEHSEIIVISDEIYEYINFTDQHFSIASIPSMKDRTVTVNGMSKGFSMTGWRIGYMAGPSWLIQACTKIQSQCTSGAASFSQKAAAVALLSDLSPTIEMGKSFKERLQIIKDGLNTIPGFKTNDPTGAFYIFPDVSELFGKSNGTDTITDADTLSELLLTKAFVATVGGTAFGDDDCIRISYAASEQNIRDAVERIRNYLKDFS